MFIDFSGVDWHLTDSAPLNIRGGGITVHGFTSGKDNIPRTTSIPTGMTNTSTADWSTAAYKKD